MKTKGLVWFQGRKVYKQDIRTIDGKLFLHVGSTSRAKAETFKQINKEHHYVRIIKVSSGKYKGYNIYTRRKTKKGIRL